jgi:hypothetical protein
MKSRSRLFHYTGIYYDTGQQNIMFGSNSNFTFTATFINILETTHHVIETGRPTSIYFSQDKTVEACS